MVPLDGVRSIYQIDSFGRCVTKVTHLITSEAEPENRYNIKEGFDFISSSPLPKLLTDSSKILEPLLPA
jgi:hypothetical protein